MEAPGAVGRRGGTSHQSDFLVLWHQQKCTELEQLVLCLWTRCPYVNNRRLQEPWATSRNREVIVQRVRLQLLFIRGVKAGGDCLSAATSPLLHVDDCNEQKVAPADNCQWTRVSRLTSIISPAAQSATLCPFSLPLLSFSFFFLLSPDLFITLQLQLICSGKLGPSTSLSVRLGRARVSWVRGQKEEEERKRQREGVRVRNCRASEESKGTEAAFTYEFWPFLLSNIWHKTFSVIFFFFFTPPG